MLSTRCFGSIDLTCKLPGTKIRRRLNRLVAGTAVLLISGTLMGSARADEPKPTPPAKKMTPQQRGIEFLKTAQKEDGTWNAFRKRHSIGTTALCTLALLRTGVKPTDAHIQRSLRSLRQAKPTANYDIALQTLVLCAVTPKDDRALIQRNVDLLQKSQITTGSHAGGWAYFIPGALIDTAGDNSNSGFAIWALDEAQQVGTQVKQPTWTRALSYWKRCQNKDGSWGYQLRGSKASGSMTCTGITALIACLNHKPVDEVTRDETDAIDRAVSWLKDNFAADHNPGSKSWNYYYLLKLRHMGEMAGITWIGDNYWYGDLSDHLKKQQDVRQGSWNDKGHRPEECTALALLALQENRPAALATATRRPWGPSGQVVDELRQPVSKATVLGRWKLGGRSHTALATSDEEGRFKLAYPPPYFKVKWSDAVIDEIGGGATKTISYEPLVLEAPRYRLGIQGIWEITSWKQGGQDKKQGALRIQQAMIDADTLIMWTGDKQMSFESYTIDPGVMPQQIDLQQGEKKATGIFRLKAGFLTLCLDRSGNRRPKAFASDANLPHQHLVKLKRFDSKQAIKQLDGISAPANAKLAAALSETTDVEFDKTNLTDGIEFLSDLHLIEINFDQLALAKAGISPDASVSLKVQGATLFVALEMLLRPLNLRFELRDGAMVITSRRKLAKP